MTVLMERHPYRFVDEGDRGYIEKYSRSNRSWSHMYECDSKMQLLTAMEDIDYARWLDPDGVPCYVKDRVTSPELTTKYHNSND